MPGLHPALNQDPPLTLELLLPRTQDREDQRRQRDSTLEEEATSVPETDSLQELVNDISLPVRSVHENAIANEMRTATSEELLCSREKEEENHDGNNKESALVEVVSKDVSMMGESLRQVKTSDRRKVFTSTCRRAGGGSVGEGHLVGKQGFCGVATCGQEIMYLEQSAYLDVAGLESDLISREAEIDGRDESDSKPSNALNREQASSSSIGSSLVGESVGSWLATTSDDIVAINTTKESVVEEQNTSVKPAKPKSRVLFANEVMEVLTWGPMEYDCKNRDVDPASAAVEWELEKNVARLETLQVDLERGSEGLGLAIMGLGAGAELGLEKLGIFVKSVTPGGVAAKDGRVKEGDQIIEVNRQSLVGVTQTHAATVLRAAFGTVSFLLGREKVVEQQQQPEQAQVEEFQATVSPESSALEEEGSGFDFSPDSSVVEIGGAGVVGDLGNCGEGKQVDELESRFIENKEILSTEECGIMCGSEQQSTVIIDKELKPLISREENVKADEVLVLKDDTENTEEAVNGNPAPEKVETGHESEHKEISARLEPSMAEKYMGLMMEEESTKRQVVTLQKLLTQREEEYKVKLADLASKMVCVRCEETMKKDEAVNRRSSIISFGRTTQEVTD